LTSAILTDVEEIKLDENSNKLKVYPNPVIDILNLDIPSSFGNVSVKIYNTTGQLYSTSNLSSDNNQIDLSPLKPGLYFVTVLDDK
jgi:serine protease AprX